MSGHGGARRLGSETPRIFTPPLRELTPETSLGFDCIEFAEEALGLTLFPWQRWFLIHALELREDGLLRFRKVILLVARQNGKTLLSEILALYFMVALGARLVLGTAQDLSTAEDIWQDTYDIAAESEVLAPLLGKPKMGKGSKEFGLSSRSTYKVKAANRRGGRGSRQVKLVLFSELREQQTWDSWGAITKTTNAVAEALILGESNAGDAASVVLRYLRMMAHKRLGDPDGIVADSDPASLLDEGTSDLESIEIDQDDDTLALFEWSSSPDADVWDRDGWAQANPSLGYTITERTLASDAASDPEWVFRTECLCQWSDGSLDGPFPPGSWEAGKLGQAEAEAHPIVGVPLACVDVSWDRSRYAISYGGYRADGLVQVELVAYAYDPRRAVDWLTSPDRTVRPSAIVLRTSGPAKAMVEPLEAAGFEVIEWAGSDVSDGCGRLYDMVRPPAEADEKCGPLRHTAHSALDVAAAVAVTKPFGDRWSWDMAKSQVDVSPLYSTTGVVWAMAATKEPTESAYESHGVEMV